MENSELPNRFTSATLGSPSGTAYQKFKLFQHFATFPDSYQIIVSIILIGRIGKQSQTYQKIFLGNGSTNKEAIRKIFCASGTHS